MHPLHMAPKNNIELWIQQSQTEHILAVVLKTCAPNWSESASKLCPFITATDSSWQCMKLPRYIVFTKSQTIQFVVINSKSNCSQSSAKWYHVINVLSSSTVSTVTPCSIWVWPGPCDSRCQRGFKELNSRGESDCCVTRQHQTIDRHAMLE